MFRQIISFSIQLPKPCAGRPSGDKWKKENIKSDRIETKIDIPKDFIQKIKKLGLREEDAQTLFDTKIDWAAVYSNNKLYCTEQTCDFFTKIDNYELTIHMINVHKYGEYKCEDPHCNYVGFSKRNLNMHRKMHTRRARQNFIHKCSTPKCVSSFPFAKLLERHMRLHKNDLDMCQYCPYRYKKPSHYSLQSIDPISRSILEQKTLLAIAVTKNSQPYLRSINITNCTKGLFTAVNYVMHMKASRK